MFIIDWTDVPGAPAGIDWMEIKSSQIASVSCCELPSTPDASLNHCDYPRHQGMYNATRLSIGNLCNFEGRSGGYS